MYDYSDTLILGHCYPPHFVFVRGEGSLEISRGSVAPGEKVLWRREEVDTDLSSVFSLSIIEEHVKPIPTPDQAISLDF